MKKVLLNEHMDRAAGISNIKNGPIKIISFQCMEMERVTSTANILEVLPYLVRLLGMNFRTNKFLVSYQIQM